MDNLQRDFDAAWAGFQNLDSLRLLPDTLESEWMRGRDSYLALLVAVTDSPVLAHLRGGVRSVEGIPGVEPYPEDYWHITVKGIGFEVKTKALPDDVAYDDVEAIARAARDIFAAQPPFEVRIGPLSAFPEVVFAEVRVSLPVRNLNRRFLEAIPTLLRYPFDGETFLPHISIARFTSNEALPELKETLARQRKAHPGPTFRIAEVQLVRARLSERAPALEPIETYPLSAR
jgi:2'-5' RNA ligase